MEYESNKCELPNCSVTAHMYRAIVKFHYFFPALSIFLDDVLISNQRVLNIVLEKFEKAGG